MWTSCGLSADSRRTELVLLLLAVLLGTASLVIAVVAGEAWFVAVLAVATAPVVIAWRLDPSHGQHRAGDRR
jgi:hypothetical protein